MLKQLIIKCSDLINRDDISFMLKKVSSVDEIENKNIQTDIIKMIQYFNFTISNIYENYISVHTTEDIVSDDDGIIYYSDLKHTPINIINVEHSEFPNEKYLISSTKIETNHSKTLFKITYKYIPNTVSELSDDVCLPLGLNEKCVIYSMASEFLASKDSFEKSEYWKNKFLYEIFKFKTKKERRIKQTFII